MSDDKKYRLEQDHPNCIGCGACVAVAPDFFEMADDGKASVIKCKVREDKWEEKEITQKDLQSGRVMPCECHSLDIT